MKPFEQSLTTEHTFTTDADYCTGTPTRLSITGVVIATLRHYFSDTKHLLHPTLLANKLWKENPDETGIRIESDLRYTPATTDVKPAIIISRGDIKRDSRGIGDRIQGGDFRSGADEYSTFWALQIGVLCSARQTGEVEIITEETSRALTHFQRQIAEQAGLYRFRTMSISKPSRLKKVDNRWGCRVLNTASFGDNWTISPFTTHTFESLDIQVDYDIWTEYETGP